MSHNFFNLRKQYHKNGFFLCKNVFEKKFISKIISEIEKAENTFQYFDSQNNLRRIEKLYDKGLNLKNLNTKILSILKSIFEEDFLIFKDKFNSKPAGGDGFFAHYDGIFHFIDSDNNKKNGWYEYGNVFINVLIALDSCNEKNGTIELSNAHKGNFDELLKNTKNNNTPALKKVIEDKISFNYINLNVGDIVVFSNTCPHRSKVNKSRFNRRVLYYTYTPSKNGSKYNQYFFDKQNSKNIFKALEEENK
jgi:2-aminoethylphosphonate dioxygenase